MTSAKTKVPCKTAIVREMEMPLEAKNAAMTLIEEVMKHCTSDRYITIAMAIKKKFDEKFGANWHCIVGNEYASFLTPRKNHFVYIEFDKLLIMLFKAKPHAEFVADQNKPSAVQKPTVKAPEPTPGVTFENVETSNPKSPESSWAEAAVRKTKLAPGAAPTQGAQPESTNVGSLDQYKVPIVKKIKIQPPAQEKVPAKKLAAIPPFSGSSGKAASQASPASSVAAKSGKPQARQHTTFIVPQLPDKKVCADADDGLDKASQSVTPPTKEQREQPFPELNLQELGKALQKAEEDAEKAAKPGAPVTPKVPLVEESLLEIPAAPPSTPTNAAAGKSSQPTTTDVTSNTSAFAIASPSNQAAVVKHKDEESLPPSVIPTATDTTAKAPKPKDPSLSSLSSLSDKPIEAGAPNANRPKPTFMPFEEVHNDDDDDRKQKRSKLSRTQDSLLIKLKKTKKKGSKSGKKEKTRTPEEKAARDKLKQERKNETPEQRKARKEKRREEKKKRKEEKRKAKEEKKRLKKMKKAGAGAGDKESEVETLAKEVTHKPGGGATPDESSFKEEQTKPKPEPDNKPDTTPPKQDKKR